MGETNFYDFTNFKESAIIKYGTKLNWYVIAEDNGKIYPFNIFEHSSFMDGLVQLIKDIKKTDKKDDFQFFAKEVQHKLMYYFWSKCEYEIIVTSFPTYVTGEEIDRLVAKKEEHLKKQGYFYRKCVNLEGSKKLDIYTQIMLNWVIFINYLWDNRKLIKNKID